MGTQAASAVLMVEPSTFGFNSETSTDNFFQMRSPELPELITKTALEEFYAFTARLQSSGISVHTGKNSPAIILPDAVFPNNWISFLPGGIVVIYPMLSEIRRKEKNTELIASIQREFSTIKVNEIIDLSFFEKEKKYLEGTGSIVFDHQNKIAYASVSPRTHEDALKFLCNKIGYQYFLFHATDHLKRSVYHTNVMLTITSSCVIICAEAIMDTDEQKTLIQNLQTSGRELIFISFTQMNSFAGNMLEVLNKEKKSFLIISDTALNSLTDLQVRRLEQFHILLPVSVPTIEKTGGGSVRCMLAEIFE
jgi:hypothetical protein